MSVEPSKISNEILNIVKQIEKAILDKNLELLKKLVTTKELANA